MFKHQLRIGWLILVTQQSMQAASGAFEYILSGPEHAQQKDGMAEIQPSVGTITALPSSETSGEPESQHSCIACC